MNVPDDYGKAIWDVMPISKHCTPDTGIVYSPIDLEAIWDKPVELADIFKAREHTFQFHERAHHIGMDSAITDTEPKLDDHRAADLVLRDSLMQEANPQPAYLHDDCYLDCPLPHIPMPWESGETDAQ